MKTEIARDQPCDKCEGNAVKKYSNGHAHCYKCGAHTFPDGSVDAESDPPTSDKSVVLVAGEYRQLVKRGLRAETLRLFDYRLAGDFHHATYYNAKGKPVAQKRRGADKQFMWVGDPQQALLFGQQLWQGGGRKVVVTEGEIDAMSMSQVQGNCWPVVSLKDGAASGPASVRANLEWLCSFDEVVFMFDTDEPGVNAALACAELLPPGKASIAKLPLKDANEMLVAGREKELVDAMWRAKPFRPDGIIAGSELWELLQTPDPISQADYPYTELSRNLHGLRRSEVVTICAGTGIGKSTACREIAYHLIEQGQKVGYIALEETVKHSAKALMSIHLNRPLHLRPMDEGDPRMREAYDATLGSDQAVFYDHWGSTESQTLLNKIRFMSVGLGCQWIVLDHISIVVSGDDSRDGERVLLDRAMTNLASLAREVDIGLIIVCHLRKAGGKAFEEGGQISLVDLRGTAAIAQLSDIVIGLERNQQSGDDNTMIVRVLKNRFSGFTGESGELVYDKETGRLKDDDPFERVEKEEQEAPDF